MSNLNAVTARAGKFDGKEYKAGAVFPYDPANRDHFRMLENGYLVLVKAAVKKAPPPPKPKASPRKAGK